MRARGRASCARAGVTDLVVVSPYNAQVNALAEALPGVRVGTVDKFQGQEADAVVYSMASSSGEDVPRGLEFLLSRNRLNVAISRARCLAYLVCAPAAARGQRAHDPADAAGERALPVRRDRRSADTRCVV